METSTHETTAESATTAVALVAGLIAFAVGCGNLDDDGLEEGEDGWFCISCERSGEDDGESSESPEPGGTGGSETGKTPGGDPVEENGETSGDPKGLAAAGPCRPRPADAGDVEEPPKLPDEVRRTQCPLQEKTRRHEGEQEYSSSVRWERTESGYRKVERGRGGNVAYRVHFETSDGQIRRITESENRAAYPIRARETVWTYDTRGRLTRYRRRSWDGTERESLAEHLRVDQTWSDGKLVVREVRRKSGGDDDFSVADYEWTWDDGRLQTASYEGANGITKRVEWSYTDGRPASVERYVDGVAVASQSWSWRSNGELDFRTVALGRRGLDGQLDEPLPATPALDGLAATPRRQPQNVYGIFRFRSTSRALPKKDRSRGCYRLPTAVGHGYPVERRAYQPIWKTWKTWKDSEPRVEYLSLYGIDGFGTAQPGRVWFGHDGVLGQRPGASRLGDTVHARVDYGSNGRMVSETVRRTRPSGRSVRYERTRKFGPDGLARDDLEVEVMTPETDEPDVHRRALRFERDERGRIRRRERLVGDELVAYQTFGYDGASRSVELDAFSRTSPARTVGTRPRRLTDPPATDDLGEFRRIGEYRRKFDGQGRNVLASWDVQGTRHPNGSYRRETTWGRHGPLEVTVQSPVEESVKPTHRKYRYGPKGRKSRLSVDFDADGEVERVERWSWSDGGRLAAHVTRDLRRGEVDTTRYSYTCSSR